MNGSGLFDILIIATIAVFLIFRLRAALGRRVGHSPPPEAPRPEAEGPADTPADKVVRLPDRAPEAGGEPHAGAADADTPPPLRPDGAAAPARAPSAPGVAQLKTLDPAFDEDRFLEGARAAFETILEAFSAGKKDELRYLLADDVYEGFAGEIDRRAENGETLETTLVAFRSAEILAALAREHAAAVTVMFVTEQINVRRDAEGNSIDGGERRAAQIRDVWTFGRDPRSRDPNWLLVETRNEP